jgi:small-conductance mechanosensitive channel
MKLETLFNSDLLVILSAMIPKILFILFGIYATQLIDRLVQKMIGVWFRQKTAATTIDETVLSLIKLVARVVVYIVAVLFILQNLGLEITALLGGLGVAGLAIAFALQKVLEDIFSFFMIHFDKPFRVGDYITVGADSGTVKHIGIRSTRLTMPTGQELLISNRELTTARLQNFKRMQQRRVVFTVGIDYKVSDAQLRQVKSIITAIFAKLSPQQITLARVHLKTLHETALIFEIAYDVLGKEYDLYLDLQEQINLELLKQLRQAKIPLAHPLSTLK